MRKQCLPLKQLLVSEMFLREGHLLEEKKYYSISVANRVQYIMKDNIWKQRNRCNRLLRLQSEENAAYKADVVTVKAM